MNSLNIKMSISSIKRKIARLKKQLAQVNETIATLTEKCNNNPNLDNQSLLVLAKADKANLSAEIGLLEMELKNKTTRYEEPQGPGNF